MSDDTKTCPYCAETIKAAAAKCRFCGSNLTRDPFREEWYRLEDGSKIAGVCSGLARHFNINVTLLRLAFVIATVIPAAGVGLLIYITLWIILPKKETDRAEARPDSENE
jgi:phage shock protein PspC (stress-responsive transcriptional regulator)